MPLFPKNKRPFRLFLVLVILHLLLISFQVPRGASTHVFERAVFFVFSPIQRAVVSTFRFVGKVWNGYFNLVGVQGRNRSLENEDFLLREENALLRRSLRIALATRDMETRLAGMRSALVPASVISLDPVNYYKSLVIDRGTLDGLAKDMVVLDRNGNLIGRVIEPIALKEASVQLITDDSSGTSVSIQGDKGLGVVTGDSRGRCYLKYILDTAQGIEPGDEVLTTGFDKIYPWGLKVGRILSVVSDKGLFKTILVQPNFRYRELSHVAVLKTRGGF